MMNDTQRVTVEFSRWLARATSGNIPTLLNADGSRRPPEVHWADLSINLAGLPIFIGSLHTIVDLVRQSLAIASDKFRRVEGRELVYNFITVRVLTPKTALQAHDCLLGRFKSEQTVYFTHTGVVNFECIEDRDISKGEIKINGSVSDKPKSFAKRTGSLFRRFKEGRLSNEQFNHGFISILTGCPMRCKAESVKPNNYLLRSLFEPRHMGHMFNITQSGHPAFVQVVFRQLEPRDQQDIKEEQSALSGSGWGI